jgi:hypothetical protein
MPIACCRQAISSSEAAALGKMSQRLLGKDRPCELHDSAHIPDMIRGVIGNNAAAAFAVMDVGLPQLDDGEITVRGLSA